ADSVGYKALVRAASDLAAKGATPRLFLLTLALPPSRTGAWLDSFLKGMGRAAQVLGMRLAGGDTTACPIVSISITVAGEAPRGHAIRRSGARAGDIIYVSGRLGRAQLGLELVLGGSHRIPAFRKLLQPHLYPHIRIELGAWLARHRVASAMTDISDGLSTDLGHLCTSSGVGARLWTDHVPRVEIPARVTAKLGRTRLDGPLEMALHGGEDYELLFSVSPRKATLLRQAPEFAEAAAIGEITRGKQILLVESNGRATQLKPRGWDPFGRHSRRSR
ncbi:MAG TPA: thiamine-phosphate kinase, partial [Candidatus Acidoferrales bacterium]|nr:thiamine-phosphate kinase [Candidatus Acidoferrales bacterium]